MTDFLRWTGADAIIARREAIRRVGVLLGGATFVGGISLLEACAGDRASVPAREAPIGTFSPNDVAFLDDVADTILPDTERSPGARAAHTGPFMALMVTDTYTADDQQRFRDGMTTLADRCQRMHGVDFAQATTEQRLALLRACDQEQYDYMRSKSADQPTHWFRMMKELTLLGFFTSEIGCTQAQRYRESPGPYQACVPYTAGETSWAAHA